MCRRKAARVERHATQRLSAHVKVTCLPGAATGIVYSPGPAQAYGISWLIRKRPPETRIGVDYRYCAGLLTSVLFYFFQINGRGKAAQSTVLLLDSTRRSDTIPHGKGALHPGTGLCRNAGGPRIVSREPTYVQH